MLVVVCYFLFFKQKTAYEMRISDWSSDVCSSDLGLVPGVALIVLGLGLAGWCLALFRRSGTNAPPHKPATAVVTAGPYGFSRNPMYLGMTVLAIGVAVWVNKIRRAHV